MIHLANVSKDYLTDTDSVFSALKEVSLTIKRGECISIVGPSGSGKSTLMHIIGLLDKPTKGTVSIEGKNIAHLSDDELSKLRSQFVGFVFQQFNLINKLTILENVMLPALYARKALPFEAKSRAMELLTRFGIADKAKSYPNKISGGQQQRTAIARALMNNPKLILADEPTGNLDSKTGKEIMRLLTSLNKKESLTVIIVTHDPTIASRTKKKIHIRDGRLV
ncbi:ABC transporter ATP-binding protein [Candidatus Gottesmanbacteria bacterium RIFCSPHIGHO2_01_FULL_46_14]|uniref:ABC transporter ATP-binding protein n=3 Tax=Candidatus Gottesmaniibacteriota TaxID=1752720 RepID=A0A1F5ZQE4_9BACT|nr:MAG: ABC transporter related protein [Candidatus Gottesmanbacteria bacterium GW2011_GWA1_47_8]OGG14726.1 MAG: ABC transporter ATP-binding protein [Candidatus Gottesmanbacteria bacterium RIFCSPHIGHO2_01_FULL_46_14]OGG29702.1 MAG: ABC transporter ATP-binding protein [Candidatus Gottesmanbacteria bacterium RIFCSPLOWO2_01_FULL_46_21]